MKTHYEDNRRTESAVGILEGVNGRFLSVTSIPDGESPMSISKPQQAVEI